MRQSRHPRRRRYGAEPKQNVKLRKTIVFGALVFVILLLGDKTLSFFGVGNTMRATAAVLTVEDRGIVNVSVDSGPLKRAENDLKLYAGDTVVSSPRNYATVAFYDGSQVRLDESTHIKIAESYKGREASKLTVELEEGTLWMASPTLDTFSGSIARIIVSPFISAQIPSQAEVVMTPRSVSVFSSDGLGLEITIAGSDQKVVIGEGQQFTLPVGGEQVADLYEHRNPLDPQQLLSDFVEKSRTRYAATETPDELVVTGTEEEAGSDIPLTVNTPVDGTTVETATVKVSGRIGEDVEKVRISGYLAQVDKESGTFEQELTLADEDEVSITIEAVNDAGIVIAEAIRTVNRNRKPPEAPTILKPAASGETYRTANPEIEISGKAPQGAIGILVNDYRLQLFSPGNTEWSYLANVKFNNFQYGKNVFEVIAINRGGYRSEAGKIIVILEEGAEEGIVGDNEAEDTEEGSTRRPRTVEEADLPNNLPLMPGSVTIFGPTKGTPHTTSSLETLIEGNVPPEATSVWVNGYRLRLFEQGKGFFNYIASAEMNTLKRGDNVYDIVVRSEDGYILDTIEYKITFTP
ncbi:MAG: hypothetical protein HOG89_01590 [Candidatus Peribacter sp.]|jgi:hypothetical protein|nr:hypothetical protein [Candidatus Peribacter sp.]MBT4392502.1 hypothetical protein [Candidatus Peribacter sp.]MBT4601331.1 hypothetical protein [Candidatus Peribacter sp.]MBT5149217.1 hypothetical protein [Candidatus Peribacter sp.]MBT5638057.1 hypothetical protein [Candidatus Peribacter sp.]